MEIVCPVCAKVDPPCIDINAHIKVCHCDECGTTFTVQLDNRRELPVRHRPPSRNRGGSGSSPTS